MVYSDYECSIEGTVLEGELPMTSTEAMGSAGGARQDTGKWQEGEKGDAWTEAIDAMETSADELESALDDNQPDWDSL